MKTRQTIGFVFFVLTLAGVPVSAEILSEVQGLQKSILEKFQAKRADHWRFAAPEALEQRFYAIHPGTRNNPFPQSLKNSVIRFFGCTLEVAGQTIEDDLNRGQRYKYVWSLDLSKILEITYGLLPPEEFDQVLQIKAEPGALSRLELAIDNRAEAKFLPDNDTFNLAFLEEGLTPEEVETRLNTMKSEFIKLGELCASPQWVSATH